MDLYRLGVKFAGTGLDAVPPATLINVFHQWIQQGPLEDLLLDVADYTHVQHGPGVLLVANEGNYSIDEAGGRKGLAYYSKRESEGDLGARLALACRRALHACVLLEAAEALRDRISFNAADMEIFANDRLLAPNDDTTLAALQPALASVLNRMFNGNHWQPERERDPAERFRVVVRMDTPLRAAEALQRLQG